MFTFASSGFRKLHSNSLVVKHTSHSAIKTDAHKSSNSTIMLYEIFLYWQIFPYEISLLYEDHQSLLYFVSCNVLSKCRKFQAVSDCVTFLF